MQVIRQDHGGFDGEGMPRTQRNATRRSEICSVNNPNRRAARLTVKK
jgi:hypothetical protein